MSPVDIVFLPMAPVLLPGVGSDPGPRLDALRAAMRGALASSGPRGETLILAPGPDTGPVAPGSRVEGFGVESGTGPAVPLGVGLARQLTTPDTPAYTVSSAADPAAVATAVGRPRTLVAVGDGSSARSDKAPGHFDPRAEGFDERVKAALENADPAALAGLPVEVARQVGAAGVDVWRVVGQLPLVDLRAGALVFDDPYGVAYFVTTWSGRWADPA